MTMSVMKNLQQFLFNLHGMFRLFSLFFFLFQLSNSCNICCDSAITVLLPNLHHAKIRQLYCFPHPLKSNGSRLRDRDMKKCFRGQLRPRLCPERSQRTNAASRQAAQKCLSGQHGSPCFLNL